MALNVPFSPADKKRIERLKNRKGRKKPAAVPARLTRTSAFAPKRRGLITDSDFNRIYFVPGHSVVEVSGRELGSQHRDALYALFRLPQKTITVKDPSSPIGYVNKVMTETSWRELLTAMGLTHHLNNVTNLAMVFDELMKVVLTVYEGEPENVLRIIKSGEIPDARFRKRHIIEELDGAGTKLDDKVVIKYGHWVENSIAKLRLVSLNADVQFKLKSDYAKSFWPFIDSFTRHTWVDEDMLAALSGRNLWSDDESAATRRDFRAACRKAFDDMIKAGGLEKWHDEVRGQGKTKTRRYHYKHALAVQMELSLDEPQKPEASKTL